LCWFIWLIYQKKKNEYKYIIKCQIKNISTSLVLKKLLLLHMS
jgi:hypothetical protein